MTAHEATDASDQMKPTRILLWVFVYSFFFLLALRSVEGFFDAGVWVDQIRYLLDRDPRMVNFFAAYGQPGTTILELGSLLYLLPGVSYAQAFHFSMIIIISGAIAACAALSSILFRHPLAWVTTVFILLPDRQYIVATPPTAAVMPLIVLTILSAWWLWVQNSPHHKWQPVLLGAIIGFSAATRLDASVLAGSMVVIVLWRRFSYRIVLPIIAGAAISFFLSDPYLWFTPLQHIADLVRKFTVHYGGKVMPIDMDYEELMRALALPAICFGWTFVLLVRRRLSPIMPVPIMIGLSSISFLALAIVLSSTTQNIRYIAPFIVMWEVLLPVLVLDAMAPAVRKVSHGSLSSEFAISKSLIGIFILLHILLNLILRPHFLEYLFIGSTNFQ
jgi:hypothetical protein